MDQNLRTYDKAGLSPRWWVQKSGANVRCLDPAYRERIDSACPMRFETPNAGYGSMSSHWFSN